MKPTPIKKIFQEENLGNLSAKKTNDSLVQKTTPLRLTIQEMNEIPAFLTTSEIEKYEFLVDGEFPEPTQCQFCRKELFFLGARSLSRKIIIRWKEEPERCNCKQAIKYWTKVDEDRAKEQATIEERKRQETLKVKVAKLFDMSKMGERFKSRTFESFKVTEQNEKAYKTVKAYSDGFPKFKSQGVGFIITGPYGTGKTHLTAALAVDLINQEIPVVFGTLINLLGKIRQTYSESWTQENELEILNTYSTVDLLIIDDLGKERASEWAIEKLFAIVNTRYENNLPIVITTNDLFSIKRTHQS